MAFTFNNACPASDQFFALFQTTGWFPGHSFSVEQFQEALSQSWYMVSAYDGDRLVGFGRVISDGVLHALITEMIVQPEYQGQGIGRQILEDLIAKCTAHDIIDIQLFCAKGKTGFYEKYGFVKRPDHAPGMQFVRENDS